MDHQLKDLKSKPWLQSTSTKRILQSNLNAKMLTISIGRNNVEFTGDRVLIIVSLVSPIGTVFTVMNF